MISKVLCVCSGNKDRSPMMDAVLQMYLDNAVLPGGEVHCESAGIMEINQEGGCASSSFVIAARRIGLDLRHHERRWVNSLDIDNYDLFVCSDKEVAAYMLALGVDEEKVHNADVKHHWPSNFQRDTDDTVERIMAAMFRVVTRFFSST